MDVRDPDCDHCKRALGPLYHHKIVGNRHLPVFTFDFSGPHSPTNCRIIDNVLDPRSKVLRTDVSSSPSIDKETHFEKEA